MTLNDSEFGAAAVECIEFGNNDTKHSGCSIVESGTLCRLTSAMNGSTEEKNASDDGRSVCRLTSAMNDKNMCENGLSKCLQTTEGKASVVDNNDGNTEQKLEKNFTLRARRKSKYLSPPFIELIKGEPSKVVSHEGPGDMPTQRCSSPSIVKSGRKKRHRRKSTTGSAKLESITASSAELLLQLHIVARDHLDPYYNKAFDPIVLLFNRFRASVFCGLSIVEQTRTNERDSQKRKNNQSRKMRKERDIPESDKKASSGHCDVNLNFSSSSAITVDSQMGCSSLSSNIKPQRKRKRKAEPVANSGSNQIAEIPDLNCNSEVPSATLDPLPVTSQGGIKSEPEKKKRMRKKRITPVTSISGIPYPNGNSVKPISIEVCLQDSGPCAFSASTVLNSNIVSSPGFCSKGLSPSTQIPPPKFQSMVRVNPVIGSDVTSPGFCAEVSNPSTLISPPKFQSMEGKNTVTGSDVISAGFCAKVSNPSNSIPLPKFQHMQRVSTIIGSEVVGSPENSAKVLNPSMPIPLPKFQSMAKVNTVIGSEVGICAKVSNPSRPIPPPTFQSMERVNTVIGSDVSSPGFCATGSNSSTPIPAPKFQSMEGVNTVIGSHVSSPGFFANSSTPVLQPKFQSMERVNTTIGSDVSSPSFSAKDSNSSTQVPPPKFQPVERVNTIVGSDSNNKANTGMTLDQMKRSLEHMTSMLEKSGDMISPAMRANLDKEIKNLLKKVDPMISSSS